jgi:hypothetical protein
MKSRSYYVIGIIPENPTELPSYGLRARTALKFIPHISLKPRFMAEDARVADDLIPLLTRLGDQFAPVTAELTGPKPVSELLLWMECMPGMAGFTRFHALHLWFEDALASYVSFDCIPREFRLNAFRPHMTIGWSPRCDPEWSLYRHYILARGQFLETVICRRLCLFRYAGDPHSTVIHGHII